ncbi:UbiX family flavin prenyltransferase [Klebsiella pneumoniae]|uniref:UbiX family flavin prenyltransferase n=1 Tax=Klebsiella pneumoniae TaxID=573 RepID=UPI001034B55B|nr:UbiX family flavin prenyltransferase [Klebsiella pneumoniae]MBD7493666.1 UbiX family flavin prenyltransferase [Klebsiella pneumoniae]MCQ0602502.1 UbiX family flavin prenyltransferase [Klebsiella pneumoniae]MDX4484957.1 UbiX family flavin prenyltransferase [Klebsiella pneumoniae]MDX4490540.1 UbiX family flavin prenyltransferase [Klebsiella pneumoniae]
MTTQRIIVGISGASGFQYGVKALELLRGQGLEVHLVVSKGAEKTCELETDYRLDDVLAMADVVHSIGNLGAAISSGSFKTLGMLVAPCSMRSLGSIAHSLTDNLLTRAADVVLKERRRLVLMVRETPLNLSHIRNMQSVTEMGGILFPPVPALYQRPQTLDEIITHSVTRALDLFGLDVRAIPRWGEEGLPAQPESVTCTTR